MRVYGSRNQTKPSFVEMPMNGFRDYIIRNFGDYSICVHGIKHEGEESQIPTMNAIVEEGLKIFVPTTRYGMAGTVEPCGLANEEDSIHKALFHYHFPSKTENINIIFAFPQSVFYHNREIYWGYPKKNTCGHHPKYQTDFNCLLSELISSNALIPREFIIGIRINNSETHENHVYLNKNYYSLLPLIEQSLVIESIVENSYIGSKVENFDLNNPDFFYESLKQPVVDYKREYMFPEIRQIILSFEQMNHINKIPYQINTAMEYFDYTKSTNLTKKDGKSFVFSNQSNNDKI